MNPILLFFLVLMAAGAACLFYGFFLEPRWIRVREVFIRAGHQEIRGKTFLYFSDLHTGTSTTKRKLDRQMRAIMKIKPDAIFFGGDLVE